MKKRTGKQSQVILGLLVWMVMVMVVSSAHSLKAETASVSDDEMFFSEGKEEDNSGPAITGDDDGWDILSLESGTVSSTTRAPQSIRKVAENVTVISKERIRAMNVHSLAEVLDLVPGLFVDFYSKDFSPDASLSIHGSKYGQVLVLLDGMRFNKVAAGINYTGTLPVEIIDRIEIIRGASSASWGSALGGVVNVITKQPIKGSPVNGMVSASFGESNSLNVRGEVTGTVNRLGYYLYTGYQESDGILSNHEFDNPSLFAKFTMRLTDRSYLTGTLGGAHVSDSQYYYQSWGEKATKEDQDFYGMLDLNGTLGTQLSYSLGYANLYNELAFDYRSISTGMLTEKVRYDQRSEEVNSQLVWTSTWQAVVLGLDYQRAEETDHDLFNGVALSTTYEENWALYLNNTMSFDRLTLTPGLRYDQHSISDAVLSPSLGMTYMLIPDSLLLRAAVAKGFVRPPMNFKAEAYSYYDVRPNPDLQHEETWSYQVGFETTLLPAFRLKTTLFLHDTTKIWQHDLQKNSWANAGEIRRTGFEVSLESLPFYDFVLEANYSWIDEDNADSLGKSSPLSNGNLILSYEGQATRGMLMGHYAWYNGNHSFDPTITGTWLWDLTVSHRVWQTEVASVECLFSLHNIFDGSQFSTDVYPNAQRWAELGLRVEF